MDLWLIWLIVAGLLVIAEMLTLTFYLLWLGLGALVAMIVDLIFPGAWVAEVVTGCVVALLLTVFTKPLTRRIVKARGFKDAVDELVGKEGTVIEEIEAGRRGIVKVGGELWSAESDESLQKGETVVVLARGSALLQVTKRGG
ncbi:NfeD family protein [Paenibacillus sp. YN15]|uniref:NfeD family protein n=1 Tax=Paenibacillus sp. YN15 TaxID=1742774 RepID=UPI000DCDDF33|nr:NfeD family protein [Paenibacillus sp. YN15]RAV01780.1 NfeD family protein [Paenibacillus sp. YN15]